MEWESPLTLIGIIATVLAMVFALAAFLTTQRRRRSAEPLPGPDELNAPPLPHVGEALQRRLAETAGNPVRPKPGPASKSAALFKQSGVGGADRGASALSNDDDYVWE